MIERTRFGINEQWGSFLQNVIACVKILIFQTDVKIKRQLDALNEWTNIDLRASPHN